MNRFIAFYLMMNMHYIFCPFIPFFATHQEGGRQTEIRYWNASGKYIINYVTTHEDGAVSNRNFEWEGSDLMPPDRVLLHKLKRTTRNDDRKAIKALLKSFGIRPLTSLQVFVFNPIFEEHPYYVDDYQ
jgi:hypothetical protein